MPDDHNGHKIQWISEVARRDVLPWHNVLSCGT
jgi:hypothetical protein